MILKTKEAEVLERLRIGMNQKEIINEMGIAKNSVSKIVARLVDNSAILIVSHGRYKVLLDTYEKYDTPVLASGQPQKLILYIPKDLETRILKLYYIVPRREIARILGLDKLTLNMMILQMGIGGK